MIRKLKFVVVWFVLSMAVLWVPAVLPQFQSPSIFRAIFRAISLIVIVLVGLGLAYSVQREVKEKAKEKPVPNDNDLAWAEAREFLAKFLHFDLPKARAIFNERCERRAAYIRELQQQLDRAFYKKAQEIKIAREGPGIGPAEFQNKLINEFMKTVDCVSGLHSRLTAYDEYQDYLDNPPTLKTTFQAARNNDLATFRMPRP